MISNKLISEVLEKNISDAVKEDDNICYYDWSNNGSPNCISIRELAYKCMVWAFKKKGYTGIGYIEPSIVFKECEELLNKRNIN